MGKLNEEQIKPVTDTEGAVLVLAGAGSGKTRVLTSRIAYILSKELCAPSEVLAITFTNKAAGEMRERLENMLGDCGGMWICTIHSMCVRILRRFGEETGIRPNFSIYSETERNNIIKKVCQTLCPDDEKMLKGAKFHIANAKTLGLDANEYSVMFKDERQIDRIAAIYEEYDKRLKENNALDFDDLLIKTLELLKKSETARGYLTDKFRYVLVDEFQDTNAVQYSIIRILASGHGNLFVVGDDDQSIYGWRGAKIENILRFDRDYPDAKIYKLQRNYRSTKNILGLANSIIANNGHRHKKVLWTEAEEGVKPEYVQTEQEADEALFAAKTINSAVFSGAKYSDFAVLMRINALTRSYEQEFGKYGIPYKVFGGFRFFERREIKDVLAYMRLIANPYDDEAFMRVINVPKRGLGDKTITAMENYSRPLSLSLYDACIDYRLLSLGAAVKARIGEFMQLMKELVVLSQTCGVDKLVREIIDRTNLRSAYADGSEEGDAKLSNLDEFIAAVDDFVRLNPQASLTDYLNQVTLSSDTDDMDDGNYVTLATIHSVKGLEFENVIICGMEEGIMPTSRSEDDPAAIEEERRLMYVAITRARKRLWITRSRSRYLYGSRQPTRPSRFLLELKDDLGITEGMLRSFSSGGYNRADTYRSSGYSMGSKQFRGSSGGYGGQGDFRKSLYTADDVYSPDAPFSSGGESHFSAARSFSSAGGSGQAGPSGVRGQTAPSGGKNYRVGMKVRHPKFGLGTIISMKNGGSVLDIAFDNQGIKELSATLAPLEII